MITKQNKTKHNKFDTYLFGIWREISSFNFDRIEEEEEKKDVKDYIYIYFNICIFFSKLIKREKKLNFVLFTEL